MEGTIKSWTYSWDALRQSKRYPLPDKRPRAEYSHDDDRCFCRGTICPEILETIVGLTPSIFPSDNVRVSDRCFRLLCIPFVLCTL